MQTSVIYQGDNLKILPDLPSESIDLIYIDPPFNSGRTYEVIWNEDNERRAFEDRYGDVSKYIDWLRPRAAQLVRVLKPNGVLFVHCDPHANYRIRSLLQDELGLYFRSEIVWKRTSAHSDSKQGSKQPGRVHDTIFFFSKGKTWHWKTLYTDYDPAYVRDKFRQDEATGRYYTDSDLTGAKAGGDTEFLWRVKRPLGAKGWGTWHPDFDEEWKQPKPKTEYDAIPPYKGQYWAYSWANLKELWQQGKVIHAGSGMPRLKKYIDEMPGVPLQDVWTDIAPLNAKASERVGFPTQKPVALLQRVLESASKEDDVVLDAFCGCGTTVVAAAAMKRKWIGIDISPTACNVIADRLFRDLRMKEDVHFILRTKRTDLVTLKEMNPWDFQNWAVIALGGIPNRRKGADLGIDGHLYITNPDAPKSVQRTLSFGAITGKQTDIFDKLIPVQVKQARAGRPDVDSFQSALRRAKRRMGVIVAFDFSRDARDEVDRVQREEGIIIHLFTAEQLLEMQAA